MIIMISILKTILIIHQSSNEKEVSNEGYPGVSNNEKTHTIYWAFKTQQEKRLAVGRIQNFS